MTEFKKKEDWFYFCICLRQIGFQTLRLFFSFFLIFSVTLASSTKVSSQVISSNLNIDSRPQDAISPSPTASALSKYITNPVGYYTGIPEIKIPLLNISLKDYLLPVYLEYHAGGIKVEEASSNVGLGWALKAGGVITRVVKDKPDDACDQTWFYPPSWNTPQIAGFTQGYGLFTSLSVPSNANFDGLDSYNQDITAYNGPPGGAADSENLLKKFYGIARRCDHYTSGSPPICDREGFYMLPLIDKEPDLFYFNFADHIGQFSFDLSSGIPVARTYPYQDLLINYTLEGGKIVEFEIIDEAGIKYIFGAVEKTEVVTGVNDAAPSTGEDPSLNGFGLLVKSYDPGYSESRFNSSWFLSKIETPMGDFLNFTYDDEDYSTSYRGPQETGYAFKYPPYINYDPNNLENYGYHNVLSKNEVTIYGKRLSAVENDRVQVKFEASFPRQDMDPINENTPLAIDKIVVNNLIGGLSEIKQFRLDYDYFLSESSELINPDVGIKSDWYKISIQDPSIYYKRLRLKSVQEFDVNSSSLPPTVFEYKYFDYDGIWWHTLPHRLSFQRDAWGIYNGAVENNCLIPDMWVYPSNYPVKDSRQFSIWKKLSFSGNEYHMKGANRLPNLNTIDIGVLTKIKYPTGGATSYEYQTNVFDDEGADIVGGGIRISRITKHDGIDHLNDIIYDYDYSESDELSKSSGELVTKPIFAMRGGVQDVFGFDKDDSELSYQIYTERFSAPQSVLETTNGSYVGYRRVVEEIYGNGKTVRRFSTPATWANNSDDIGVDCNPSIDGHCDGLYHRTQVIDLFVSRHGDHLNVADYDFEQNPALPNTFPFPENPNYDWQRGHLLSTEVFSENGNPLVKTEYSYKNYFPHGQSAPMKIYGYKIGHHYPTLADGSSHPDAFVFRISKYNLLTEVAKVLSTKTVTTYDQSNPLRLSTLTSLYSYENTSAPLLTKVVESNSKDQSIEIQKSYPSDLAGNDLGSDLLISQHRNNILLREIKYSDDQVLGKTEVAYDESESIIIPTMTKDYSRGNSEVIEFNKKYDTYGNIVEQFRANDIHVVYLWGYNHSYVVAKIIGATLDEIKSIFSGQIPDLGAGGLTQNQDDQIRNWVELNENRATVSTYKYEPLVGLISEKDQNGNTTSYEYDSHNRLIAIRDNNMNIIKMYDYKYAVQN